MRKESLNIDDASEPLDLRLSHNGDALLIDWEDGHTTNTSLRSLRWSCPCAECAGEMDMAGRLSQVNQLPDSEYRLEGAYPIGRYAFQLVWASGHDSGIYTYEYLRGLCECSYHTLMRERRSPESEA